MIRKRGFVLVCVLWVLAILTVVTLGLGRRAVLDRRAAAYSLDRAQAALMARGAVRRAIADLKNKAIIDELAERDPGITHLGQPWAREQDMLKGGEIFKLGDAFENDSVVYRMEDEERRVNVNRAAPELLDNLDALSRTAARKIYVRTRTGEQEGDPPAAFHTLEEIRHIEGVRDEDWFGTKRKTGLRYLLTTWGDGRININTASEEVLASIPGMHESDAAKIIEFRAGSDGELGTGDDRGIKPQMSLVEEAGIRPNSMQAIYKYCKYNSELFKITGEATRRNGAVRVASSAVVQSNGTVLMWQEEAFGS